MKGCLFHFGQALHKKLKKLQLSELYIHNQQFHKWIRIIFALALLPHSQVNEAWLKVLNQKPKIIVQNESVVEAVVQDTNVDQMPIIRPSRGRGSRGPRGSRSRGTSRGVTRTTLSQPISTHPIIDDFLINDFHVAKINQFVHYFDETYLSSSIFPIQLWNHFETAGPRTNNHVEGYNNKLKCFVGAAKPNIYKIVNIFKNEETNSDKKFRNATTIPPSKPPPRDNYSAEKDTKLKIYKDLLSNKDISLDVNWLNISSLYEFKKKEKNSDNDATLSSDESDTEEETTDDEYENDDLISHESDSNGYASAIVGSYGISEESDSNGYASAIVGSYGISIDDELTYFNL